MKFLIDAQLPQKLVGWLQEKGHDAIHTLDLPRKNATSDLGKSAQDFPELTLEMLLVTEST